MTSLLLTHGSLAIMGCIYNNNPQHPAMWNKNTNLYPTAPL